MTFLAVLSTPSSRDVSVPFTLGGTAQAGADYTITTSPVTIPAGGNSAAITITMYEDTADEEDETVIVTMGTPVNAVKGSPSVHTATIVDNDAPVCEIFDDNELQVNSSAKTVAWTISNLSANSLVLSGLTIEWPAIGSNAPKLDFTLFGPNRIWDGNKPASPTSLDFGSVLSSYRTLSSSPTTVTLGFTRVLLPGDYVVTLNFRNTTQGIDCPAISRSYHLSAP
jgi:hypothetical protein